MSKTLPCLLPCFNLKSSSTLFWWRWTLWLNIWSHLLSFPKVNLVLSTNFLRASSLNKFFQQPLISWARVPEIAYLPSSFKHSMKILISKELLHSFLKLMLKLAMIFYWRASVLIWRRMPSSFLMLSRVNFMDLLTHPNLKMALQQMTSSEFLRLKVLRDKLVALHFHPQRQKAEIQLLNFITRPLLCSREQQPKTNSTNNKPKSSPHPSNMTKTRKLKPRNEYER